jgi:hypothetical protein
MNKAACDDPSSDRGQEIAGVEKDVTGALPNL